MTTRMRRALGYGVLFTALLGAVLFRWYVVRSREDTLPLRILVIDDKLFPRSEPEPTMSGTAPLVSQMCTQAQFSSPVFARWRDELKLPHGLHCKNWEWVYIVQALHERGMLADGKRGLGFGVGKEQLPALFATYGVEVVATDLEMEKAIEKGWVQGNQHMDSLEVLNERGIATREQFARLVKGRDVDMTAIPGDLRGFDFVWSTCALGHLGNLEKGLKFIDDSLATLRPGGVAVHTTELNLSSNTSTMENSNTSVYRRRDIEALVQRLRAQGHEISVNFNYGRGELDTHIDAPPYTSDKHLKIELGDYVSTSLGLIIRKNPAAPQ